MLNITVKSFKNTWNLVVVTYYKSTANKSDHIEGSNNTKSSVIRQRDESQNGGDKKTKHAKFSEKTKFS